MGQGLSPIGRRVSNRKVSEAKLEKRLEAKLVQEVKKLNGIALKLYAAWYVGIPDRMLLLPRGQIYFIELKREGKGPRPNQVKWINRLNKLGFDARVVAGKEQLEEFLNELHLIGSPVP